MYIIIYFQGGMPLTPSLYGTMSCHDLACSCSLPQTVKQCKGQPSKSKYGQVVYERTYVTPPNYTWSRRKGAQKLILNTELLSRRDENKEMTNEDFSTKLTHKNLSFQNERFYMEYTNSPLLAKKPFLVSSPHWASRGHLQQWPWRSTCV